MIITMELWHPDDLQEMLNYMVDHLDATPEQLYNVCFQITSGREQPEELEMEEE